MPTFVRSCPNLGQHPHSLQTRTKLVIHPNAAPGGHVCSTINQSKLFQGLMRKCAAACLDIFKGSIAVQELHEKARVSAWSAIRGSTITPPLGSRRSDCACDAAVASTPRASKVSRGTSRVLDTHDLMCGSERLFRCSIPRRPLSMKAPSCKAPSIAQWCAREDLVRGALELHPASAMDATITRVRGRVAAETNPAAATLERPDTGRDV